MPGESTEKHIMQQLLKCKFWGGLALGSLAVIAYLFDVACQVGLMYDVANECLNDRIPYSCPIVALPCILLTQSFLGTTLATTSLLIIVGAVMQTSRQVESLLEGPRLQEKLQAEQNLIQSLRVL